MDIRLVAINTKFIHSNLAAYMLEAYARKSGINVSVGEYTINHNIDHILEAIYRQRPDVVCFSCYLWNISYIRELALELNRLCPKMDIWLGGPEVTYDAKECLKEMPQVKGIMRGEGEQIFVEVCKHYQEGRSLSDIRGITYRSENEILENPDMPCLDLDDLPFPYENLNEMKNRIIYYESSRGCPFSCSYCLSSVDHNLRFKSLPKVFEELKQFIDARVPQVKFVDRTYNAKVDHALAIWNYIKDHDNGVTNFHFEIAADILREEEIECLQKMRPGLIQLEIGVQSTNEKTIHEIHRVMSVDTVATVTKRLKKPANMNLHLDLIAGLPYEDIRSFQRSFDDLHDMRPHQLQLGFLKVLKGSYMYQHAKEYEIVYHVRPPYEVLQTKWLSFDDILKLKGVEQMVEIYYNSGQFSTILGLCFWLRKGMYGEERAFDFYCELSEYYRKMGYMDVSHNRIRKYEILMEFLKKKEAELEEDTGLKAEADQIKMLNQAMIYDLYLRENLKSRPDWVGKMSSYSLRKKKELGSLKHVECMEFDFTDSEFYERSKMPDKRKIYVMFDYENRSPVTGNVAVQEITVEE